MTRLLQFLRRAFGTPERAISMIALIVSLASAAFSYVQSQNSAQQLMLNAQQLRPHITYVPTFFPSKQGLRIDMYLQNHSPLPAHVLFADVATSIDGQILQAHFYSIRPDIIHQRRDGVSTLPLLANPTARDIGDGKSMLLIATCAVYASTAQYDQRRWMVRAINEYLPGSSLPSRRAIEEQEVTTSVSECDAKRVFAELPTDR